MMGPAVALSVAVLIAAGGRARERNGDHFQAAQADFNRGSFDAALRDLDAAQAEASDPLQLSRIFLLRAQTYAARQDYGQAEVALGQALEFDPDATLDPAKIDPALVKMLDSLRARLISELKINSEPAMQVKVDGVDQGTTPLRLDLPIGRHAIEAHSPDGKMEARQQVVLRRPSVSVNLSPVTVSAAGGGTAPSGGIGGGGKPVAREEKAFIPFAELRFDLDFSTWGQDPANVSLITALGRNFEPSFGEMVGGGFKNRFFRASASFRFRPFLGFHLRGALSIPLLDRLDAYVGVELIGDFIPDTLTPIGGASLGSEYFIGDQFGLFAELGARHNFSASTDDVVLQVGGRVWFP